MDCTRGEWKVAKATETGFDTLIIGGDDGVVADTHMSWRQYSENEANAHLIAAAPLQNQTLDVVRTILYDIMLRHNSSSFHNQRVYSDCGDAIKLIDKALAKAEGK